MAHVQTQMCSCASNSESHCSHGVHVVSRRATAVTRRVGSSVEAPARCPKDVKIIAPLRDRHGYFPSGRPLGRVTWAGNWPALTCLYPCSPSYCSLRPSAASASRQCQHVHCPPPTSESPASAALPMMTGVRDQAPTASCASVWG
jgi:hypothetical protein